MHTKGSLAEAKPDAEIHTALICVLVSSTKLPTYAFIVFPFHALSFPASRPDCLLFVLYYRKANETCVGQQQSLLSSNPPNCIPAKQFSDECRRSYQAA